MDANDNSKGLSPELVEAAARARCKLAGRDPDGICSYNPETKEILSRTWEMYSGDAEVYLSAALPIHEAEIRKDERERVLRLLYEQAKEWRKSLHQPAITSVIEGFADRCGLDLDGER